MNTSKRMTIGGLISAALISAGLLVTTTPAVAQSYGFGVTVGDDDGYVRGRTYYSDRPYYQRTYRRGYGYGYPGRRYLGAPVYGSQRCIVKVTRFYDDDEGAYVTRRKRVCRY